jgi:hypothetical protein
MHFKKNEGQKGKAGLLWVGKSGHWERVNEGKYGIFILYSYMKIEG